jgi:UDP-N-acetyl-D-mannosaminuronic acid dehydrogenase
MSNFPMDVCIVGGAGHVGLPLAIVMARAGLRVGIYDVDRSALATIASGKMPSLELDAEPLLKEVLRSRNLTIVPDIQQVVGAEVVVITIGTPIDEFLNPVHKVIKGCIDSLLSYLHSGQLVVLRSTVSPGTTDWLHRYRAEIGKDMRIAFCPERVVQGHSIRELQTMPQIVSGTTPEAAEAAAKLFRTIAPEIIALTPMEAEFAKLFNNAYRYIEFAITNQFYMIANSAGVDYYRVLDAMTRNYPRIKGMPSAGFTAGPCLLKDTMQLGAFARNHFSLGHAAMFVNEGLVLYLIDRLRTTYPLEEMTVGLLGMAFKADSDDIRASLSYKLKKDLMIYAKEVLATDPLVSIDSTLRPLDEVIRRANLLILCVPHSAYHQLDVGGKPVIDIWNFLACGTRRI